MPQEKLIPAQLRLMGLALLFLTIFTGAAQAALSNITYSTTADGSGGVIITGFSASGSGPLTIPSTVNGFTVTGIGADNLGNGAFLNQTGLTSVTIPNTVTSIGSDTFDGCSNLASVTMPNTVTSIGGSAFTFCSSLTSISIPNKVTSIGTFAFLDCTSLTSVTIGSGLTTIPSGVFEGCTGLTSISFPGTVTNLGYRAFYGCSKLTTAYFWGNAPTTMGGQVFGSVASGFTVDYYLNAIGFTSPTWTPDANDSYTATFLYVTSPSEFTTASDGSGGLVITAYNGTDYQVYMPDTINGLTITSIGADAFFGATSMTYVTLPAHLTSIGYGAFYGCSSLNSVVAIPNSVTSVGAFAFYNCSGLTTVSFGTGVGSIGQAAFQGCSSLASAAFPGNAPTMGGNVFASVASGFTVSYYNGATGFTSPTWTADGSDSYPAVNLGNNPAQFTTTTDGHGGLIITGFSGSTSTVIIPATINGLAVTAIGVNTAGTGPFQGKNMTSVIIPNGVTSIGYQAFGLCGNLASVSLPGSLTSIGTSAFYGCNLTSVIIPANVTSIGGTAFENCTHLATAMFLGSAPTMGGSVFAQTAPSGFTVEYYTGATGFTSPTWTPDANDSYPAVNEQTSPPEDFTTTSDGNGGLVITAYTGSSSTVVIPGTINGLTVTAIGLSSSGTGPFQDDTTLTSVTVPNGVTSLGYSAFQNCTGLTGITLPNSLTYIGNGAFAYCTSLASITLPSSLTNIDVGAFSTCTSLTSITLPNSLTSIALGAFSGCTGLTSITLPTSITSVGGQAFEGCTRLTSVTIPASVTNLGNSAFANCTNLASAVFLGNAPTMGGRVFYATGGASGFTVDYYSGATGFTSPTWMPDALDNYSAINMGPFSGLPLGGGWNYSAWFGTYNATYYPWIYRTDLGFIYVSTSDNTNLYLYVVNGNSGSMGWLYTTSSQYPNVYSFSRGSWLYYYSGGTSFYNYTTRATETY